MLGRLKKNAQDEAGATGQGATGENTAIHKRLGDFLLEQNLITGAQLDEAIAIQKKEGGFIGQILVRLNYTTQEAVASCLVKQCKIPHLNLLDYDIDPNVLSLIPDEVCRKHNLLPIDKLGRILTVAMVDPLDLDALQEVRTYCAELRIKPILCNWEHFETVSRKVFSRKGGQGQDATLTAQSLGLVDAAPPRKAAPAPVEEKAPTPPPQESVPAPAQNPAPASASATADAAGVSSDALAGALQQSIQQAFNPMRDSLQQIMTQNAQLLQTLAERQQNSTAAAPAASPGDIAQSIQEGVSAAMEAALGRMAEQMQHKAMPQPEQAPSMESIADSIRDGVSGAMEEAMAAILVQMRAQGGKTAQEGGLTTEGLKVLADSIRQSLETSQKEQSNRLAEIAEAMLQSVQQQGLRTREESSQPRKHEAVSAFLGADGSGAAPGEAAAAAEADKRVVDSLDSEHPHEELTFETFLPGDANAFTYKLSQAVSASPGSDYNPYFLFGRVGVGKTHLINAIGNAIKKNSPGMRVGYVSASHFARCLQEAVQEGTIDLFREAYCHWDVLILDDIQFLGGRVEAQEEFFHIFNVLYKENRQIIIASDKGPDQLGLMEKRLISRFGSGIVAELRAPEMETRLAILKQMAEERGQKVPESILTLIAMRVSDDIRRMTGALRKIMAYAKLVGQDMSHEMADEILNHLGEADVA